MAKRRMERKERGLRKARLGLDRISTWMLRGGLFRCVHKMELIEAYNLG